MQGAIQADLHEPGVTVTSATAVTNGDYTSPAPNSFTETGLPMLCAVTLTDQGAAGNLMNTEVWLPADWNGRFLGVGGGGFSCGIYDFELASGVQSGYATAATDCGLPGGLPRFTGSYALNSNDTLNLPLIDDFAYNGIHQMSVVGKEVTQGFYSNAPAYSYFDGCSTGGREALQEAQKYPGDYNGIVSGSPAINWTQFIPAEIWPELVMMQSNDFLPTCKESAFTQAVVAACGTNGVILNPSACRWSPFELVGTVTPCGTITATDAAVVAKIWGGPTTNGTSNGKKLWYGLEPGASFAGLAGTVTSSNGVTTSNPFPIAVSWLGTWVQQNPNWDWQTLTYAQFDQLFSQSEAEFTNVIETSNPNLTAFRDDGGKILIYHGLADQLIFPQGTINYYRQVQHTMGGPNKTDSFARLFLAPGAQHCASAAGPMPDDPLGAVVNWVEHGQAPASLVGTLATGSSSLLCMYPLHAAYTGSGPTNQASSYQCVRGKTVTAHPFKTGAGQPA
ncbi:MAG: tannase/feruloyl esterase family alpha/beta hydrolase [Acidimicrobiales bacterium]